jgi:hypothetical protein
MVIRIPKICGGYLVAIVCAQALGYDGCPERFDEEIGSGAHPLKCHHRERVTVMKNRVFGKTFQRYENRSKQVFL